MSTDTESDRGAVRIRGGGSFWQNLTQQHRDAFGRATHRMRKAPLSAAFGIGLIAFAWLLPLLVHWLERNVSSLAEALASTHGAQVFLSTDVDENAARALADRWRAESAGLTTRLVTREEGLAELAELPGFRGIDTVVGDNPLPIVISVDHADPTMLLSLVDGWRRDPAVDFVQSDARLKRKLEHMQDFVAGASIIAFVLALAGALLISIHLSRLAVNADRDEISVSFWLGAPDAWIRRPLLYGGMVQGFIGAALAAILVLALVAATHRAMVEFSRQFAAPIDLLGPDPRILLGVIGAAVVLGWLGAFVCTTIDLGQLGQQREDSE